MKFLSGKDKKDLSSKIPTEFEINKKDEIKEDNNIIYKNGEKYLIIKDNKYLPHLKAPEIQKSNTSPHLFTDKGAIPFVAKGADLMKPGIARIGEIKFNVNDIVLIKDENKEKTYAIGFALLNSEDMRSQTSGKSIQVYHYIGDEFY